MKTLLSILIAFPLAAWGQRVQLLTDRVTGRDITGSVPDRVKVWDISDRDALRDYRLAGLPEPVSYPWLVHLGWNAGVPVTGSIQAARADLRELRPDNTAPDEIRAARQTLRQARNQLALSTNASIAEIHDAALAAATTTAGDRRLARVLAARITLLCDAIQRLAPVDELEDPE